MSDSNNIQYNVLDEDVNISIPPKSVFTADSKQVFRLNVKIVGALVMVLVMLSICGYFYKPDNNALCVPFQKVTVRLVEAQNYSCHDNTTCDWLMRKVEGEQDGLMYNFVIGSDMELYIGLGFKCRLNYYHDELLVKLITPDLLSNSSLAKGAFRVFHIIDEGLNCGNVVQNYSVKYTCDADDTRCSSAVDFMSGIEDLNEMVHQSFDSMAHHTIHIPNNQTQIILHKAFRWTACGEATHEARNVNVIHNKVVTLDSLPRQSCQPFNPVDQIDIELQEIPNTMNCSDSSCSNLVPYIESHHDGHKYSFVIDEKGRLYIGLGFRCQAQQNDTASLRIKILARDFGKFHSFIIWRVGNLVEEALVCDKILKKYSVNLHPVHNVVIRQSYYIILNFIEKPMYLGTVTTYYPTSWRLQDINHHTDSHVKLLPHDHKMMACSRTHSLYDTIFTTGSPTTTSTLVTQTDDDNKTTTSSSLTSSTEDDYEFDCYK